MLEVLDARLSRVLPHRQHRAGLWVDQDGVRGGRKKGGENEGGGGGWLEGPMGNGSEGVWQKKETEREESTLKSACHTDTSLDRRLNQPMSAATLCPPLENAIGRINAQVRPLQPAKVSDLDTYNLIGSQSRNQDNRREAWMTDHFTHPHINMIISKRPKEGLPKLRVKSHRRAERCCPCPSAAAQHCN